MHRPTLLMTVILMAGTWAMGAEDSTRPKKKSPTEPFLREGMEWTGTFSRTTPDKLNENRINKKFHTTDTDPFQLRIERVEGAQFGGTLRFGRIGLQFEGVLLKDNAFQLKFTKILKGHSPLLGGVMVGAFGANGETIQGTCGQAATGRRGALEGTLKKAERQESRARP